MDCPKKDCDGQVEAWFKVENFCGVTDEGEPDYVWSAKPSEETVDHFECSQCAATWIDKQQLLMDVAEKQGREKGETAAVNHYYPIASNKGESDV